MLFSLFAITAQARSDELIVPGDHNNLNPPPFVEGSGRFQFVYGAALFPLGLQRITALAFSPELGVTAMTGAIQIRLGITTAAVDALVADLDANATSGVTTVLDSTLQIADLPGGTESWTLSFAFDTPFDYDPAQGNLLVDVVMSDVSIVDPFAVSARSDAADLGSRAIDHPDVGNGADTIAPRIRFTVPEPDTSAASLAAALALIPLWRSRRARAGR